MSMVDETPDYFIRDGKIYAHHQGSTYVSGGFRDHEPSYNQLLEEATPVNINKFLRSHNDSLYNYDTGRMQTFIESDFKDAFGEDIFKGSIIYCMNNSYDDRFIGYIKGEVIGFTPEYVKIKVLKYDKTIKYHIYDENPTIKRMPHRIIVIHE